MGGPEMTPVCLYASTHVRPVRVFFYSPPQRGKSSDQDKQHKLIIHAKETSGGYACTYRRTGVQPERGRKTHLRRRSETQPPANSPRRADREKEI